MDLRLFPRRRGLFRRSNVVHAASSPASTPSDEGIPESIAPSITPLEITTNPAEQRVRNYVQSMADFLEMTVAQVADGKPARQYAASMGIDISSLEW